jgi:hypothetical protein
MDSKYYDERLIQEQVETGNHRALVGEMWSEIGQLQFDYLKRAGLQPTDLLLDVGCGCFRGGVHFIAYLNAAHYYGIDISPSLLAAGRVELQSAALSDKLPLENLLCASDFNVAPFGRSFDFAIAQSLFTHLGWNNIRLCLENLHPSIRRGGRFFATYFHLSEECPRNLPQLHIQGGVITFGNKDPYHYRASDFERAIHNLPWTLVDDVAWDHPRAQRMLIFRKS